MAAIQGKIGIDCITKMMFFAVPVVVLFWNLFDWVLWETYQEILSTYLGELEEKSQNYIRAFHCQKYGVMFISNLLKVSYKEL